MTGRWVWDKALLSSCAQAQGHPAHVTAGLSAGRPGVGAGNNGILFLKLADQEDGDSAPGDCLPGLLRVQGPRRTASPG